MTFKVKPFLEVVGLSKEALDEAFAPIRAKAAKAKAELFTVRLEEEQVSIERQIYERCADKDINFDMIISLMDKYDLNERKHRQVRKLLSELFPDA